MERRRKRIVIGALLIVLLAGILAVVWTVSDWPPPGMVLRYGLTPGCEPTGKTDKFEGVGFVEIGPGCFRMGSTHLAEGGEFLGRVCAALGLPWGDQDQPDATDEMPVHWVEFRRGFWIARTEVTNEQYEAFDPKHERSEYSPGDRDPVVDVSWDAAVRFCTWLAERAGVAVRLPSEAEWECACRAGSKREFCFGDDEKLLTEFAWTETNSEDRAHEVGTLQGSAWGLHDLHGNVSEWCEDTYHANYEGAPVDGAAWTEGGEEVCGTLYRVVRGGGFVDPAAACRSAYRDRFLSSTSGDAHGFRPAFSRPSD